MSTQVCVAFILSCLIIAVHDVPHPQKHMTTRPQRTDNPHQRIQVYLHLRLNIHIRLTDIVGRTQSRSSLRHSSEEESTNGDIGCVCQQFCCGKTALPNTQKFEMLYLCLKCFSTYLGYALRSPTLIPLSIVQILS